MGITIGQDLHVVMGLKANSTMNTASTGDVIDASHCHTVWALFNFARPTAKAIRVEAYKQEDYAGTNVAAITTGIKFWKNDGCQFDRLTAATSSASSHTDASSTGLFQLLCRLDPTHISSSQKFISFGARNSSQATNFVNLTYMLENRYPGQAGAGSWLATTSST